MQQTGKDKISSEQIGRHLGESAFTIRKDLNYLGATGTKGSGYTVKKLSGIIRDFLFKNETENACIIGLGKLGALLLEMHDELFTDSPLKIVAGFDNNVNKIETLPGSVPLYPMYELEDIVKTKKIALAIMAVPGESVNEVMEKITSTSICCIVNYSSVPVSKAMAENINIHNINLNKETKYILAKSKQNIFNYGKSI